MTLPPEDKIVHTNPSRSDPDIIYYICIGDDLNIYCTCPSWQKGSYKGRQNGKLPPKDRECRHTEAYKGG